MSSSIFSIPMPVFLSGRIFPPCTPSFSKSPPSSPLPSSISPVDIHRQSSLKLSYLASTSALFLHQAPARIILFLLSLLISLNPLLYPLLRRKHIHRNGSASISPHLNPKLPRIQSPFAISPSGSVAKDRYA